MNIIRMNNRRIACPNARGSWTSRMRILRVLPLLLLLGLMLFSLRAPVVYAVDARAKEDAEQELGDSVQDQLDSIDFAAWDKILSTLGEDAQNLFGNGTFLEKVESVINGDFAAADGNLLHAIFRLLFGNFGKFLPLLVLIVAISVLGNFLHHLKSEQTSSSVLYFACFSVVVLVVSAAVLQTVKVTKTTVESLQTQMNAVFPILLTVMAGLGGTASVAIYQPMFGMLTNILSGILTYVVMPMFMISYVFQVLSNINPNLKLARFSAAASSISKWIIGLLFTVFSALCAIRGITAGTRDGISFRTAKYAISHYIPIVGGYLSDGLNLILAGSVLVKNAVGVSAILLMLATVLVPLVQILALKLGLMLTGAVLEPLSESGYGNFCTAAAKSLNMILAVLLSVAFLYFICLMLVVMTANFVVSA